MKKIFKYGIFPIVIFVFLVIVTVILTPVVLNVQKFVPAIEKKISEVSGRPFSIGPDLAISFFPWLSISFSEMKFGNPPGFLTNELVKIDSFEARIKLLPLLKKEIQISRFVVGGLEVNLEKNSDGKTNWECIQNLVNREFSRESLAKGGIGFLQGGLHCTLLAITDGRLNWLDRTNQSRHSIENLMLLLTDVTVDHPIVLDFKASYDGKPIALEGKIGPLWQKHDNEPSPLDISFQLLEKLQGRVQGEIGNWRSAPAYDITLNLAPFSPRAVFAALDISFPAATSDPSAWHVFELGIEAKGNSDSLVIKNGKAQLDDTRLAFSGAVKNFIKPEIEIVMDLDRLDLDRYFPPQPTLAAQNSVFWRDIVLTGALTAQTLKFHGATVTEVDAHFAGSEGTFTVGESSMALYGGQLQGKLTADLQGEMATFRVAWQSQGVQIETLWREFAGQDILSGTLTSDFDLEFTGNTAQAMWTSLSGEATFSCLDGAIQGVDLFGAIVPGQSKKAISVDPETLRTEFSELKSVVALNNGLVNTYETTLLAPAMSLLVNGTADLVGKQWNLRVVPMGMEANEGKGKEKRPMPLLVTGTFANPELKRDSRQNADKISVNFKKADVANIVDEKLPSPVDADVKDLVGKPLIDPAIVAKRFHLQPEEIKREELKKQLQVGEGKVRINPLQVEPTR